MGGVGGWLGAPCSEFWLGSQSLRSIGVGGGGGCCSSPGQDDGVDCWAEERRAD